MTSFKTPAACVLSLTAAILLSTSAHAQEVTLQSSDGTTSMTGDFVEFRDNAYTIETDFGPTRISAEGMICTGAACPDLAAEAAKLIIGGSDTIGLGLMPAIFGGYANALNAELEIIHTGKGSVGHASFTGVGGEVAQIDVHATTTGDGFAQLLDDRVALAMASRRITPAEARALQDQGAGNMTDPGQEHILALDSLIVVTHPNNPVDMLSFEQLRAIYSGEVTNWSAVGGTDMAITVVGRPEGSGSRSLFETRIFGEGNVPEFPGLFMARTNGEAALLVADIPGAIAYVGSAFQRTNVALTLIDECGIAMVPDSFSTRAEDYALQRRLYLYARADTLDTAGQALLDYTASPATDEAINRSGFVGFGIERQPQALDVARAQDFLMSNASPEAAEVKRDLLRQVDIFDRLSTTFRFDRDGSTLDARGRADIERLISYLESQPAGTEVLLAGFTDDLGEFAGNLALSRQRAEQLADDLRDAEAGRLSNVSIAATGFGEIAPTACNSSDIGRHINRRVEVWINTPT